MARRKCTGTQECELSARAVGHLKDCPLRQTDAEKRLEAQPETAAKIDAFLADPKRTGVERVLPEVPLDDLLTPAEKERIGDASKGMTVTYDTSPISHKLAKPVSYNPYSADTWQREEENTTPARPWWKFWGRRG